MQAVPLHKYVKLVFPNYKNSEFAKSVVLALIEFTRDWKAGKRPILLIEAPPQHGKSELVSQIYPAWILSHYHGTKAAIACYSYSRAAAASAEVNRYMLSSAAQRYIPWVKKGRKDTEAERIYSNGSSILSVGTGGGLTGRPLDLLIIDDPYQDRSEARSRVRNNKIHEWYSSVARTRLSNKSATLCVMTRWALEDIGATLIKQGAKNLKFQAISSEGKALIPELHTLEQLLEEKARMPDPIWQAVYQQNPISDTDQVFDIDLIKRYTTAPAPERVAVVADTAFKTKQENDYSVFTTIGLVRNAQHKNYDLYILRVKRGKWEVPDLLPVARNELALASKQGRAVRFFVEDKASGTGIIQQYKRERVNIVGIQRNSDKSTRALESLSFISRGQLYFPEQADWLPECLEELADFRRDDSHKHDDFVDTLNDAIAIAELRIK